jgi:hypothetical protein
VSAHLGTDRRQGTKQLTAEAVALDGQITTLVSQLAASSKLYQTESQQVDTLRSEMEALREEWLADQAEVVEMEQNAALLEHLDRAVLQLRGRKNRTHERISMLQRLIKDRSGVISRLQTRLEEYVEQAVPVGAAAAGSQQTATLPSAQAPGWPRTGLSVRNSWVNDWGNSSANESSYFSGDGSHDAQIQTMTHANASLSESSAAPARPSANGTTTAVRSTAAAPGVVLAAGMLTVSQAGMAVIGALKRSLPREQHLLVDALLVGATAVVWSCLA